MDEYQSRVDSQIKQYEFVENMHDLPDSFHYYSFHNIRPRVAEVFGVESIVEMFARGLSAGRDPQQAFRFLSVGSGDAAYEEQVARHLRDAGYLNFVIECAELSPIMTRRAYERISQTGLSQHFKFTQTDLNAWVASDKYDGVMAHHSLHHIVELEHVFLNIRRSMKSDANFCIADMIGRNGHMRWPEVLEYVDMIWKFLAPEKRNNHQLKRYESTFQNTDCSTEGFEGIRAQDILPLLMSFFSFSAFTAWGGLVEVFFDRAFGWNFDSQDPADKAFIEFIARLNDDLINSGRIKPTQMLAILTAGQPTAPPKLHRNLTPAMAVRWPG